MIPTINVGVLSSGLPGSDPLAAVPLMYTVSRPPPNSDFSDSFPKSVSNFIIQDQIDRF